MSKDKCGKGGCGGCGGDKKDNMIWNPIPDIKIQNPPKDKPKKSN